MENPVDWYLGIPPVTRSIITASVALGALVSMGFVSTGLPFAYLPLRVAQGEVWRPFTALLYNGALDVSLVMDLFWILDMSRKLEELQFAGTGRYAWVIAVTSCILLFLAPFAKVKFLGSALSAAIVHLWSRYSPEDRFVFPLLFQMRAPYFSFFMLFITASIQMDGSLWPRVLGIIAAQLVFFMDAVVPLVSKRRPLATPFGF